MSLEDRVVASTAIPLESAAVVPANDGPSATVFQPEVHGPGCGCPQCVARVMSSGQTADAIPAMADPVGPVAAGAASSPPYPGQTFLLHSRPSASHKIFLDFNGHATTGTWWNADATGGAAFTSSAFNFEGTNASFSANEEDRIQRIWQRVTEDYSPFDVDVTTEDPGLAGLTYSGIGDDSWGIRVVITPDDAWVRPVWGKVGGLAYVSSYKTDSDTTCYIFSSNLGPNNEGFVAEAISHEVGHTLGLSHDGTSTLAYYSGHAGSGTPSWAPIMGVGYGKQLVQWSRGEYLNANETEDDLSIITDTTNNFDYRPDDAGNSIADAKTIGVQNGMLSFSGVIERPTDLDVLKFSAGAGDVSIVLNPWVNSPNLDIRAELRNADGSFSIVSDSPDSLAASISATIPAPGDYYLVIEGVGVGNITTSGYGDYGSLGQYTITGSVVDPLAIGGTPLNGLNYLENQSDLTLNDLSLSSMDANLREATVTIGNREPAEDLLIFSDQQGISGCFNEGVLTLSGVASVADYQTALRSVRYRNLSDDPSPAPRTLTIQVCDTAGNISKPASLGLNILAVNDQPTLNIPADLNINEDAGLVVVPLTGISAGVGENQFLTVTATSGNPTLILNLFVTPDGLLQFTPAANLSGIAVVSVTVTDDGGSENGGVNAITRTFSVTVNPVNDAPGFRKGDDVFAVSLPNPETYTNWATNLSSGPPDEAGQRLSFRVMNDAPGLFAVQPSIDPDGTLTFVTVADDSGVAIVTVELMDDGGTINGGVAVSGQQTFKINVGVNRAPELRVADSVFLNPVARASAGSLGTKVRDFALANASDPDAGTYLGIAITAADTANGTWQFSLDSGKSWSNLGLVDETASRLLRGEDVIRFVSDDSQIGTSGLTYHAWDQTTGTAGGLANLAGNTGGQSAFGAVSQSATVRVAAIFSRILEDAKTGGGSLSGLSGAVIADQDPNARRGIAVVGSSGTVAGSWQFSVNGGVAWIPFGEINHGKARLLRSTDRVRFLPAANQSGDVWLTYHAWDQSVGAAGGVVDLSSPDDLGGGTAYSSGVDYLFTVVTPVNDRPVLDAMSETSLTPVAPTDNDPLGELVAGILGSTVTDVDMTSAPGLAVTAASKTGGIWEYQLDGETAWQLLPKVTPNTALLLAPADRLRFVPNGGSVKSTNLSYKAWDRTTGRHGTTTNTSIGTSFSVGVETATLTISSVAAFPPVVAPVLEKSPDADLTTISEDSKPTGDYVLTLLGGSAAGIAVTNVTGTSTGVWQFSSNNGSAWKAFGEVSPAFALLLKGSDKIRYVPNLNFNGDAEISYRAWNRSRGTVGCFANLELPDTIGGTSPFSLAEKSASVWIQPVNDPPVLDTKSKPALRKLMPGTAEPVGDLVARLLGTAVSDPDAGAVQGIAVTKASTAHGVWEYRLAGEAIWNPIILSNTYQAICLRPEDSIRFVPQAAFIGVESISYRAWDQTSGTAGTITTLAMNPSVSVATESATITVSAMNERPTLDISPTVQLPSVAKNDFNPAGVTSASLLGTAVTLTGAVAGIAITSTDNVNGRWEFSISGADWAVATAVSTDRALLLKATDRIRFVPNAGFVGSTSIRYKAWDGSDGYLSGQHAITSDSVFSAAIETASLAVNIAPVLTWG